ncbi:hypothetical protein UJ101_00899 [Flavobacteriaceae bacterium UJ101]|nr:hypothetical protein UJ101_00899 [Flavobacteriaceae bacterium UJ101]
MNYLFYSCSVLNLISFLLFGIDKFKARKQLWRISELTLLVFAFLGPLGALLGMNIFRHKTQKWKFKILIPLFLIIQLTLFYFTQF